MKVRKTSKAAYDSLTLEHKRSMWVKIIKAASKLPNGGNFEQIAKKARLKPDQVWKRLPELVDAKVMYNTGETAPTSTGRQAMVRRLTKKWAA